jgi:hypothetical protein
MTEKSRHSPLENCADRVFQQYQWKAAIQAGAKIKKKAARRI